MHEDRPKKPLRRTLLLAQSGALLLVAQGGLRLAGYRRTRSLLGRLSWLAIGGRSRGLGSVSWGVQRAAELLPTHPVCLPQALVAELLLLAAGHDAELKFGVRAPQPHFEAHAWVVSDGRIVVGGREAALYSQLQAPAPKGQEESQSGAGSE